DRNRWIEANIQFARYLRGNPPVVVAASYAAAEQRDAAGNRSVVDLPMLRDGLPPPEKLPLPELPEFSIGRGMTWNPPRVGLIDTLEGGTRWVPMFAPTAIRRYDHMALNLAALYWGVDPSSFVITADTITVPSPDGGLKAVIPLIDQQLVEINWFSPWHS